jgi:hypothetical protein
MTALQLPAACQLLPLPSRPSRRDPAVLGGVPREGVDKELAESCVMQFLLSCAALLRCDVQLCRRFAHRSEHDVLSWALEAS